MTGILTTVFEEEINALTFVGNNYAFNKGGRGDAEAEHKQFARTLRAKKVSQVAFVLKAIYNKVSCLNSQRYINAIMDLSFKVI